MADSDEPVTTGGMLREARERLGLSVDRVAQDMRLSRSQIEALEANDYQPFHGDTYVRGYLRGYARLVGLDADSVTPETRTPVVDKAAEKPEPTVPEAAARSGRPVWIGTGALLAAGAVVYWVYSGSPGEAPRTTTPAAVASATGSGELALSATAPAWVEVRDSRGRRLLYQHVAPGRDAVAAGQPPFRVYLGNARVVEVRYNGAPYALDRHIQGLYARFVIP